MAPNSSGTTASVLCSISGRSGIRSRKSLKRNLWRRPKRLKTLIGQITLHSYRVRWELAARSPAFEELEKRVAADPVIHVSTLIIHGGNDPCNDPETSAGKDRLFADYYKRHVFAEAGHFPQRQNVALVTELAVPSLLRNSC